MTAKPNQPDQRDRALARLLTEALQPGGSAGPRGDSDCPDAELMAAYAEQGLAQADRERLDVHFADCGRCQKILAVLTVSGDDPLTEQEVRRIGALAAETRAPAVAATPQARPSAQRWFWWLAPALGAAAAVMLWLGLRPATPGGMESVQTAADYSAARQASPQETDMLTAQQAPPATEAAPQAKVMARTSPGAETEARNEQFSREALPQGDANVASARDESARTAVAARASEAPASDAPMAAMTAAPAAPAPLEREAAVAAQAGASAPAQVAMRAMAAQAGGGVVFAAPDGNRRWRLSPGGRIEHSTDGGQTWQAQPSGVTTELVAGAAPSGQAAWVVGRAGVILRLTDAQFPRWQRLAVPAAPAVDWASIEALDASRATVTAADGRRFTTENAGGTWVQQ